MSLKPLYTSALIAFCLVLISFGSNAQAQQPTISFPASSGGANASQVIIPINLSNPGMTTIDAFAIEITFNNTVLDYAGFDTSGTLCAPPLGGGVNCSIADSETVSGTTTTIRFVGGTASGAITTSGILFKVGFNVIGAAGSTSGLNFVIRPDDPNSPVPIYEQIAGSDDFPFAATNGTFTVSGATAASATVAGRVIASNGRGLRGAQVRLRLADGSIRTAVSTSLGYYRFTDVNVGQTVTLEILSKRYGYQPITVNVAGDMSDLNFLAER